MPANVETMFSYRQVPWHGMGAIVNTAPNSAEAIVLAGLDWNVEQKPVYADGKVIPGYLANQRNDNGKVLGIVSGRYKIVQNNEAFDFADAMLNDDYVTYETAGALNEGRTVWMLARLNGEFEVAGDEVEHYLLFSNSHNGLGSIRVAVTPVRVVCQNTLQMALANTKRCVSIAHRGSIEEKLEAARETLGFARQYTTEFQQFAESLRSRPVLDLQFNLFVNNFYPIQGNMNDIQVEHIEELRNDLTIRYYEAPDLEDHRGNAWGVMNAVSDHVMHKDPIRRTKRFEENRLASLMAENTTDIDEALQTLRLVLV